MSNPEKRWSWGKALGKATGAAIGGGPSPRSVGEETQLNVLLKI